jgi:dehydrogenase/reductase SDR family protein 1
VRSSRVALVTGGSRGVGRGIAVGLGGAGWTVWVTGRSSRAGGSTSHLPGTVEDTAEAVTAAGGRAVAARCDHSDDEQVRRLAGDIEAREGRLDLLVNNVWGGYERLNAGAWPEWNAPAWEQPIELWDAMQTHGVRAHYVASVLLAPLMIRTGGALIVTVSMGAGRQHDRRHNVAYSVAKAADDRLALALDVQLRDHGVRSLALHPGLVRTEGVMQFAEHLDLTDSQSPESIGRVVAALAADADVSRWGGQAIDVSALASEYGIQV